MPPANATSRDGSPACRRTTNFWWWLPPRRTRWSRITSPPACSISWSSARLDALVNDMSCVCERHTSPRTQTPRLMASLNNSATVGPSGAQPLVRVALPVGEEQMVPGPQLLHLVDQPVEVGGPVHQGLGEVARCPRGQVRRGVTALVGGQQPGLRVVHRVITYCASAGRNRRARCRRR